MRLFSLPSTLTIHDRSIPVILRENCRAKRLTLRWISQTGEIVITMPPRHSRSQVHTFLQKSLPWIEKQVSKTHPLQSFAHGMIIPLLGKSFELQHRPSTTLRVWWGEDHVLVHAPPEKLDTYVRRSLKQVAHTFLSTRTQAYASQLSKSVNRISLRETRSRWGSCSSSGNISYCWLLVFAPEEVADYVCAHEVAHLEEMNHSPKFWKIVSEFMPHYQKHREWLKQNGKDLFQYGDTGS